MADQSSKPLQFFVRLLDGKSLTLSFSSPLAYGEQIKQRIFEQTKIPTHLQRLISGGYQISDGSAISQPDTTVNLVLSLRGGKGGFGSLLRGAGTKAGQKKTNNFDACRDMSGRRLRHVNAENRLQEWKEGEEERKLEKSALEFLKKQANKVKQGVGNGATQKYVNKYKEESDKCILAVDLALNESFKNGKRKGKIGADSEKKKRLKIWKGKRAVEDSDSDDSSDEEDEKSVVINNGGHDGDSSGKSLCNSGSEEENDFVVHHRRLDVVITGVQGINEEKMDDLPVAVAVADAMDQPEKVEKSSGDAGKNLVDVACETLITSAAVKRGGTAKETVSVDAVCCKPVGPLNFDDFNSATDMEVLGMERLKTELQSRGLKCGGTLQERAARLFLLKSTPLDKLPKKLLAKK
ncbi:ubiquitin family protein [Arabidopsis lyrata subsp. lyrata]|uniref:Ubiquitin family protein n=1 Tax=Arabidopsis lyrata subsp. lyrata TaxID=81972 RepID=D7M503_ARALL|nr:ubiquitin family protein [Arabidopsis lyrata subsp. lyrata]